MTPIRDCFPCQACCFAYKVPRLKAKDEWCQHAKDGKCEIYEERPDTCKEFNCCWKTGDLKLPEVYRPDLSGLILTMDPKKEVIRVVVYRPTGIRDLAQIKTIIRHAFQVKKGIKLVRIVTAPSEFIDTWADKFSYSIGSCPQGLSVHYLKPKPRTIEEAGIIREEAMRRFHATQTLT